jgi:uncharacterized protein YjiS (DUF1127 family)
MYSRSRARQETARLDHRHPGFAPWAGLGLWQSRRRTRLALRRLDARLIADIGVTMSAARKEAAKPFWTA